MNEAVAQEGGGRWGLLRAMGARLVGRVRRSTFFLEFTVIFAVIALILTLAVGYALSAFLARDVKEKTLGEIELVVSQLTAPQIASQLSPELLAAPLSGQELATLDKYVRERILNSRIVRVNIWNAEGTIIYSTVPELIGRRAPDDPELRRALSGHTLSEVREASEEAEEGSAGLEGYDALVGVYTPLLMGDPPQPVGAIEIYQDYSPIAAHIADIGKSVLVSIAAALGFLYLALMFLVRRGSATIRRQRRALQNQSEELKNSYESIVAVLCAALDLRDNVTHGHARRVSEIASVVAWQMGLRKEQLRQIEKAAILHDIGKIGVADAVLSKAGPLTHDEWAEMKRHPELGYQILKGIDFLKEVAEIVYAHHERWDGKGYPRGLKGEEIPLGARIFAVVDAYDAMTSHRPYRRAMPHSKAVEEIMRNSGSQFDPQVVKAFLEAEKRGLIQPDGNDVGAAAVLGRSTEPAEV